MSPGSELTLSQSTQSNVRRLEKINLSNKKVSLMNSQDITNNSNGSKYNFEEIADAI